MTDQTPREFAAHLVNSVKETTNYLATGPDGQPRDLTFEQAAAVAQVAAINAVAAALLAVADAANSGPVR